MLSLNAVGKKRSFLEFPFYLWALKTGEILFKVHLQVAYLLQSPYFNFKRSDPHRLAVTLQWTPSAVAYSSTQAHVICL